MDSRRWIAGVLALVALGLLPWALLVNYDLPSRETVHNWDVAWTGFDIALVVILLAAAIAAYRRSAWLARLTTVAGTWMLADAWFDVVTASPGTERTVAVILALAAELPLAALCFAIAAGRIPSLRMIKPRRRTAEESVR